jgi:hypothetical protein
MTQHRDNASDIAAGESTTPMSVGPSRLSATALSAGAGGNLLEWYDFGIYGLLAPVLATIFFPAEDRIASLMAPMVYSRQVLPCARSAAWCWDISGIASSGVLFSYIQSS